MNIWRLGLTQTFLRLAARRLDLPGESYIILFRDEFGVRYKAGTVGFSPDFGWQVVRDVLPTTEPFPFGVPVVPD
jgi:hypothetical protein